MRVEGGQVYYTPSPKTTAPTSSPSAEKSVPVGQFESEAYKLEGYSKYRREGVTQKQIVDTLKALDVLKEVPDLEQKIDLLESFHSKEKDLEELSKTLETHFKSAMQTEYLDSVSQLPSTGFKYRDDEKDTSLPIKKGRVTTETAISAFNTETIPNQTNTFFVDSGISPSDDKSLLRFTSLGTLADGTITAKTETKDTVLAKKEDGSEVERHAFSLGNLYSPTEWDMKVNFNYYREPASIVDSKQGATKPITRPPKIPTSKEVPAAADIAKFQSGLGGKISSKTLSKPDSIKRDTVVNPQTIKSMNDWYKANVQLLETPPLKMPTTMEDIKRLGDAIKSGTHDKLLGLSEVENFLLNTPNGGTTKKILEDIHKNPQSRIASISLSYDCGTGKQSYEDAFNPTKPSPAGDVYSTHQDFIITIKYVGASTPTVLRPPTATALPPIDPSDLL